MKDSTGIRELADEKMDIVTGGAGERTRDVIDGYLYYQLRHGRMTEEQVAEFINQPIKTQIKGLKQGVNDFLLKQNNKWVTRSGYTSDIKQ